MTLLGIERIMIRIARVGDTLKEITNASMTEVKLVSISIDEFQKFISLLVFSAPFLMVSETDGDSYCCRSSVEILRLSFCLRIFMW